MTIICSCKYKKHKEEEVKCMIRELENVARMDKMGIKCTHYRIFMLHWRQGYLAAKNCILSAKMNKKYIYSGSTLIGFLAMLTEKVVRKRHIRSWYSSFWWKIRRGKKDCTTTTQQSTDNKTRNMKGDTLWWSGNVYLCICLLFFVCGAP